MPLTWLQQLEKTVGVEFSNAAGTAKQGEWADTIMLPVPAGPVGS